MATEIHENAIVAPGAHVGDDCRIGPYCVVGSHVTLGTGTVLHSHVVVDGDTVIGAGCELFPFACIGKRTQDLKYAGGQSQVVVGDNTTLREYVTIHQSTDDGGRTVVGNNCSILAYCHIAHDCTVGNGVIMSNAVNLAGHVVVEDDVVFGGLGGIHQFVRIGEGAMVSATAKVVQDVVPYCLADGNPASIVSVNKIGMRRHGHDDEAVRAVSQAFKLLFRSNMTLEKASSRIRETLGTVPEVQHMLDFAAASERGLARPRS